jgi:hypothetical protein
VGIPEHHPDKFWAKNLPMADLIRSFSAQIWDRCDFLSDQNFVAMQRSNLQSVHIFSCGVVGILY